MARGWLNAAVFLGVSAVMALSASRRTPSLLVGQRGAPLGEMAALEAQVARDPSNPTAVVALARGFLERGSPGLALAVLERSPGVVQASAAAADVAATAMVGAGHNRQALALTRQALSLCDEQACEASLLVRATQREELLDAVLAVGIEDMDKNPEGALQAYRRAVRQVRVAMN